MSRTSSKLTAKAAIAQVLGAAKGPMQVPAIIEAAVPLTNLGGATPGQTIYSVLYSENKKSGNARQFISTGRGTFKLNPSFKATVRSTSSRKTAATKTKTAAAKKSAAAPRKRATAKKAAAKKTTARRRTRSSAKVA